MDLKTIPPISKWLIFTDLDGTLLDHHNYSHQAAKPALDELRQYGVPVILNSSKTPAEIEHIANELNFDFPQIAENGSIIYYPESGKTHYMGADYAQICSVLDTLRNHDDFKFSGFHDWSATEISARTGLDIDASTRASKRQGSEPILWQGDETRLEDFRSRLREKDLELKRGGRFWHVMGQTDKVKAMQYLQRQYQHKWGNEPFVIALGDSANDRDMLAAANIAVIVHNPDGTPFALPHNNTPHRYRIIRTTLAGPAGWNEAISELLGMTE